MPDHVHPPVSGRTLSFGQRGGWWVMAQGLLMVIILILSLFWRRRGWHFPMIISGSLLFIVGGAIGVMGARALGRGLTPFPKPNTRIRLVRHGIYAHIRHPLYTSTILMAAGWALLWHSLPALVVSMALVPFFTAKARYEEHFLKNHFPEYEDYKRHTHTFLPWI